MDWPGLLITAPFATVRRNQLCQVFKAREKAAAHYTEQTHFIDPKSHRSNFSEESAGAWQVEYLHFTEKVAMQISQLARCSEEFLVKIA